MSFPEYIILFVGLVTFGTAHQRAVAKDEAAGQPGSHSSAQSQVNPLELTMGNLSMGRDAFYRMCVTCNGMDGKGQTDTARAFVTKPSDFILGEFRYDQIQSSFLLQTPCIPTIEEIS